ncbi:MAG: tetratricopeptide repeat protein [Acidobacteriota bacterium]
MRSWIRRPAVPLVLGALVVLPAAAQPTAAQPVENSDAAAAATAAAAAKTTREQAPLERVLALEPEDILKMTPEMEVFLAERIRGGQIRATRLRNLQDAIFNPNGLGVTYGNTRTKTAEETFHEASGNCLSFTMMFVTLARHLGLDAYFVEVDEVTSWSNAADVDINAWHMFAEVGIDNGFVPVDFLPGLDKRYRRKKRITDTRVAAHYFNNLGVEALTGGDLERARRLLHRALELDRKFLPALVNLGVAEKRAGRIEGAEQAFRRALDVERANLQAIRNLASLYTSTGRTEDAAPLLDRVERYLDRNPFHHFRLSRRAAAAGRHAEAVEHLEMAIRRQSDVSRFHEALSEAHYALGDYRQAIKALDRATRLTEDEQRRAVLDYRRQIWRDEAP